MTMIATVTMTITIMITMTVCPAGAVRVMSLIATVMMTVMITVTRHCVLQELSESEAKILSEVLERLANFIRKQRCASWMWFGPCLCTFLSAHTRIPCVFCLSKRFPGMSVFLSSYIPERACITLCVPRVSKNMLPRYECFLSSNLPQHAWSCVLYK